MRLMFIFFLALIGSSSYAQQVLELHPAMLYNFSTKGNAGLLIDEAAIAIDPANGNGGEPETVFSAGWPDAAVYYPVRIVIDLGALHHLSSLWVFDVNDADSLWVYSGDPSSWQLEHAILLNTYNQWRELQLEVTTQMLMLVFRSPSSRIAEMVLYGTPLETSPSPPTPILHQQPPMEVFMGINGFVDDPVEKLRVAGSMREYHDWGWDEGNLDTTYAGYPNNQYAWNPSWVSGPGWGFYFDDFYASLKQNGIFISPDLQGAAPFITGFNDSLIQHKPIDSTEPAADPLSYIEHADYLFQFAARYGHSAVNPALLKLRPDQEALSGLGLVNFLENWNEPDKWWFGRGGYFAPDEFAAMCSADYDGHEGALGATKGMKNADPDIKMVMGGLASLNLEYLRCMKLWSDYNRQTGFPADVLNFHHYSGNGLHGISPEADSLKEKLKVLVDYRNRYLPGKEIWLSEFGYDTNPESPQASRPIDTTDAFEVQGQWILRSYLEAAAAGIDRAFVFMLRDVNAPNPNIYNSSGLTGELWYGHQPKKSWYYVHAMKHALAQTSFRQEIQAEDPTVKSYAFANAASEKLVLAIWSPTEENRRIPDFQLNLANLFGAFGWDAAPDSYHFRLIIPIEGDTLGTKLTLQPQNGVLSFEVSERPVFLQILPFESAALGISLRLFNADETLAGTANDTIFSVEIISQGSNIQSGGYLKADGMLWMDDLPSGAFSMRLKGHSASGLLSDSWIWKAWGGASAVDALIMLYMTVGYPELESLGWIGTAPYTAVFQQVADVNNSGTASALDALTLLYRTVGYPGTNPFPENRHNFVVAATLSDVPGQKTYPNAPQLLFSAYGMFEANSSVDSVYYELSFPPLDSSRHYLTIYPIPAGDVNASFGGN